jgi:hypothetical protein
MRTISGSHAVRASVVGGHKEDVLPEEMQKCVEAMFAAKK